MKTPIIPWGYTFFPARKSSLQDMKTGCSGAFSEPRITSFQKAGRERSFFSAASARRPVQEKNGLCSAVSFRLLPIWIQYGNLLLIYHSGELPYDCPLINERIPLNHDFIKATYTVWSHLIRDPLIFDLVEMDSDERTEKDEPLLVLYP